MTKNLKSAFTLAEVLITLGVIGVVAAVTMPTLIQQYKERETVARVNQFYSMFSQAYLMAVQEHGTFEQWGLKNGGGPIQNEDGSSRYSDERIESWNRFFDIMSKYLKYTSFTPITSEPVTDENGISSEVSVKRGAQLANGVAIRGLWINTEENCKTQDYCGDFYIVTDAGTMQELRVDGKAYMRNRTFNFILTKDRIVPIGLDNGSFKGDCLTGKDYSRCTGWVIRNKNMDYLHCKDLDMNTKTKCK